MVAATSLVGLNAVPEAPPIFGGCCFFSLGPSSSAAIINLGIHLGDFPKSKLP
jgi:hypothetical protein